MYVLISTYLCGFKGENGETDQPSQRHWRSLKNVLRVASLGGLEIKYDNYMHTFIRQNEWTRTRDFDALKFVKM